MIPIVPTPEFPYANKIGVCVYCGVRIYSGMRSWEHTPGCKNYKPLKLPKEIHKIAKELKAKVDSNEP